MLFLQHLVTMAAGGTLTSMLVQLEISQGRGAGGWNTCESIAKYSHVSRIADSVIFEFLPLQAYE
jgi:hypothetical protein